MSTITAGNVTVSCSLSADTTGNLVFQSGGNVTAMTIDTSQNVGIGTSSPAKKLHVNGDIRLGDGGGTGAIFTDASVGLRFMLPAAGTSTTESMRIDSSGNLLVGTTSAASYGAGTGRLYLSASGANWQVGPTSAFANFYVKAGTGFGVGMTTTATSWSSDSDERKKTALTPFANAAEKVCSLRAGTGRYLTDEENMSRSFLIAQDVQAVLPEAVDVGEDEDKSLMLRYTDLIPLLTAAIQEQQQMIEELKAEVAALKGASA